jgi:streptogramin lyase
LPATAIANRAAFDRTIAVAPVQNASVAQRITVSHGVAFVMDGERVRAIDLAQGTTRWTSARTYTVLRDGFVAGDTIMLALRADFQATDALRRKDGTIAYTLRDATPAGILNGVLYARHSRNGLNFAARRVADGSTIWDAPGGGCGTDGPPRLLKATLLQAFCDSGAILVRNLYAFDVRTGRTRWVHRANRETLGVAGDTIYIDSTWFPMQLDNYIPLTVARLDVATGATVDEITYAPDPAQHAHPPGENPGRADAAAVSKGFVYMRVGGVWYRYDADVSPSDAHPTRLDGIDEILAWFDDGALLVAAHGSVAIAHARNGRLELRPIAASNAHNDVVARSDGTRYVVAAGTVYAFTPDGGSARELGRAPCAGAAALQISDDIVTAICSTETSIRALGFRDPIAAPPTPAPVAMPKPPPPPSFRPRVTIYSVPPRPESFGTQWWLGPMAALPDGGVAFLLDPGNIGQSHAIGRATRTGVLTRTLLPGGDSLVMPEDIAVDSHGTTWFNDRTTATLSTLDARGTIATRLIGEASPSPQPRPSGAPPRMPRLSNGIRLAIGPDGEAWFARSQPTRVIGRADGSVAFPIPAEIDDIIRMRGDRDGFWFVTRAGIGHVSAGGRFSAVFSPLRDVNRYSDDTLLSPAADGSVWVARKYGLGLVRAYQDGVLRPTPLPDATMYVRAMTVGCDGALYVAESIPRIARIAPNGHVDEFPVDVYGVDGITRGSDCRLWFAAGSNSMHQQIGTLELKRHASGRKSL